MRAGGWLGGWVPNKNIKKIWFFFTYIEMSSTGGVVVEVRCSSIKNFGLISEWRKTEMSHFLLGCVFQKKLHHGCTKGFSSSSNLIIIFLWHRYGIDTSKWRHTFFFLYYTCLENSEEIKYWRSSLGGLEDLNGRTCQIFDEIFLFSE